MSERILLLEAVVTAAELVIVSYGSGLMFDAVALGRLEGALLALKRFERRAR